MGPDPAAMSEAVVQGDAQAAERLARAAVEAEADLVAAVEQGFAAGLRRVGALWEAGEYFLPELVQGAEAMKAAMAVLLPALRGGPGAASRGVVVLGTVSGDLHDIGKGLVGVLLSAHGFEVRDLGTDVPVEAFVASARETGARIVAASALLTTTMQAQRELVRGVAGAGLTRPPAVLVGGAPTSAAWAREIGATWAENALAAARVALELTA